MLLMLFVRFDDIVFNPVMDAARLEAVLLKLDTLPESAEVTLQVLA